MSFWQVEKLEASREAEGGEDIAGKLQNPTGGRVAVEASKVAIRWEPAREVGYRVRG
jgi:hypothetical protein